MYKFSTYFLLLIAFITLALGCSGNSIDPLSTPAGTPEESAGSSSSRLLSGIWNVRFDPGTKEISLRSKRNALIHYDITPWLLPPDCSDCVEFSLNSYNPGTHILDVDVTIRNPTQVTAYDVRGILYTNDYGHLLTNADAWTDLWDLPGGDDINPFKAFAKEVENRAFIPDAEHTANYLIHIPSPPHWNDITFAVDVSWPSNCKEPYAIENFALQGELYDYENASVEARVDIFDWQDDIISVQLEVPQLTGTEFVELAWIDQNTWGATFQNTLILPSGEYDALLIAESTSAQTGNLYKHVPITVSQSPLPMMNDITPFGLNFCPVAMCIDGDYIYVCDAGVKIVILDISDPTQPEIISKWGEYGHYTAIAVRDGYAYVGDNEGRLQVLDVDPPTEISLVYSEGFEISPTAFDFNGNYLYVTDYIRGLFIFDITQPDNPVLLKHHILGDPYQTGAYDIVVPDGYAFVASDKGLMVVDVDPPEDTYIVKEFPHTNSYMDASVHYQSGYVYLFGIYSNSNIYVFNASIPEDTFQCGMLELSSNLIFTTSAIFEDRIVAIEKSFASEYVVVDISTPEEPFLIGSDNLQGYFEDVEISQGYAFFSHRLTGMTVFDLTPAGMPVMVGALKSPAPIGSVECSDDYAYVTSPGTYKVLLQVIDISTPQEALVVGMLTLEKLTYDTDFNGEYIFAIASDLYGEWSRLNVVDISDPSAPFVTHSLTFPGKKYYSIAVKDGLAYLAGWDFAIVDIDPLGEANLIYSFGLEYSSTGIKVDGGYAFVSSKLDDYYEGGITIVDVDPPGEAHAVNTFDLNLEPQSIAVSNGLAYLSDGAGIFRIVDVSDPESPVILKTIDQLGTYFTGDIELYAGYAYIGKSPMHVIDINPVEDANLSFSVDARPGDLFVSNNILFHASGSLGLRIYELY